MARSPFGRVRTAENKLSAWQRRRPRPRPRSAPTRGRELIEAGEAELIDVRRPYEWEAGRIEGARQIEINELTGEAESIPREAGDLLLPVWKPLGAGRRGLQAGGMGRLQPGRGLRAWVEHGLPLDPADGEVAEPGPAA